MLIFVNVIKRIFTKKSNLLFMLILPTLLSAFIIFISVSGNKYTVGILDHDQTEFTTEFKNYLAKTCKIVKVSDEDAVEDKIMNDGVESIFVFDEGDTNALIQDGEIRVKSYYQEGSNYAEPIQVKVASYLGAARLIALSSHQKEDIFYQGMHDFQSNHIKVDYLYANDKLTDKTDAAMTALGYMAFCMLFLMTFSTSLIMEDKISGVCERLWISPLSRVSYYVQHILAYFTVSIIQTVVVVLVLPIFGKVSFGETYIEIMRVIFVCLLFSLACIAMGVAINNYAKNKLAAGSISSLINLPILMLGGCLWPYEEMPDVLQKIGRVLPTTWFLKAGNGVIYGGTLGEVVPYLLLLLCFIVVVITVTFLVKLKRS